jgi:hypothetical protein
MCPRVSNRRKREALSPTRTVSDPVLQEDLKGIAHEVVVVSIGAFEVPRGFERDEQLRHGQLDSEYGAAVAHAASVGGDAGRRPLVPMRSRG